MMSISVFDYQDYRKYLQERIRTFPKQGHGIQAKLAQFISCQSTYVSRVLQGRSHFSLEQGQAINRFLGHTKEEAHFYLLLLQFERAGSKELASYFQSQIEEVLQRRLVLKERLKIPERLSEQDQLIYYSEWHYSALHVALTIPELRSREALSRYFDLPLQRVSEILDFLSSCGLAIPEGANFQVGPARIHLGSDSPLVMKSHINWRLQAIRSLEQRREDDLHYSSVISLSKKDAIRIKADLIKKIEEVKAVVKESPEEILQCFALDLFRVR